MKTITDYKYSTPIHSIRSWVWYNPVQNRCSKPPFSCKAMCFLSYGAVETTAICYTSCTSLQHGADAPTKLVATGGSERSWVAHQELLHVPAKITRAMLTWDCSKGKIKGKFHYMQIWWGSFLTELLSFSVHASSVAFSFFSAST